MIFTYEHILSRKFKLISIVYPRSAEFTHNRLNYLYRLMHDGTFSRLLDQRSEKRRRIENTDERKLCEGSLVVNKVPHIVVY